MCWVDGNYMGSTYSCFLDWTLFLSLWRVSAFRDMTIIADWSGTFLVKGNSALGVSSGAPFRRNPGELVAANRL